MLIALGVTGGIGAYKAVEVARGLQKRGHDVVAVMTRGGHAVRRAADLRGDHAAARHHRPVRARRQRRHRAHRAGLDDRPAAGRAGDRQHHRQVRQRHRRRLPVVAVPGDARAGAAGAGDEHATCWSTRPCGATSRCCAARGVRVVEPGEGFLACGWIGKGRLAEPDEIVAAAERCCGPTGPLRGTPGAGHGRADLRGHRPGPLRRATGRAAGWGSRWRPRRRAAGPQVTLVAGPTSVAPPAGVEVVRVRQRRRDARGRDGACRARGRGRDGGRRGRLHARAGAPEKIAKEDGPLTLVLAADAGHPRASWGAMRAAGRLAGAAAGRLRRRDAGRRGAGAREARRASRWT